MNEEQIFSVKYFHLMIYCSVHSTEGTVCYFLNISIIITLIKVWDRLKSFCGSKNSWHMAYSLVVEKVDMEIVRRPVYPYSLLSVRHSCDSSLKQGISITTVMQIRSVCFDNYFII